MEPIETSGASRRAGHRRSGVALALWRSGAFAAALVTLAGVAWAERAGPRPQVRYYDRGRCGVVVADYLAPRTHLTADLDGDGVVEHYVATWGGVELHRLQEGTHPPTYVRQAVLYSSRVNHQYSCVDLAVVDIDHDGDLDLVYGGHRELVIFRNDGGRLSVLRREAQDLPAEADVRVQIQGSRVTVRAR